MLYVLLIYKNSITCMFENREKGNKPNKWLLKIKLACNELVSYIGQVYRAFIVIVIVIIGLSVTFWHIIGSDVIFRYISESGVTFWYIIRNSNKWLDWLECSDTLTVWIWIPWENHYCLLHLKLMLWNWVYLTWIGNLMAFLMCDLLYYGCLFILHLLK